MIDHALPASYIAVLTIHMVLSKSVNVKASGNCSSSVLSTKSIAESIDKSDKSDEEESQETSRESRAIMLITITIIITKKYEA